MHVWNIYAEIFVKKFILGNLFTLAAADGRLFRTKELGSGERMQTEIGNQQFLEYLDRLGGGLEGLKAWEKTVKNSIDIPVGASCIVFNANPFTNGHRYLAEIASKRSSLVLVLVIQGKTESGGKGNHEDTGLEFPFKDRLRLVEQGLQDLGNVAVLPSGPFIVSRDDYPQGYLSDILGAAPAHAKLDGMVFCHVLGALGIGNAFAGDEPRDELSEIHLNALRQECRTAGITLRVAERKRLGDRYISSSMVRDALSKGRKEEVAQIVPPHVLEYLGPFFS